MTMIRALLALTIATIFAPRLPAAPPPEATIRVATYNTSLYRDEAGQLIRDLETGDDDGARRVAEVVQRLRPDVLLINEFDYDEASRAARLFLDKYLAVGQNGCQPIGYPHHFAAPVNTGRPSGRDFDKDGLLGGPADAIGYGRHEGQYGMLVLTRFPFDRAATRTFREFLWRNMPESMLPTDPQTGNAYYDDDGLNVLRLSSKSFWDLSVLLPPRKGNPDSPSETTTLHLLCSHPTPPVFDGPEDRNGRRNHDEIRLIADYLSTGKGDYLVDDQGRRGSLPANSPFIILGDLNCDPVDGQGVPGAIAQLLDHSRVDASFTPASRGGPWTVQQYPEQHTQNHGDPKHVTADFTGEGHGCLRIDYALPSRGLELKGGGVFWPAPGEPGAEAVTASDHRPVWIDIRIPKE